MQKVLTGEEPDVFAAANEGKRLANTRGRTNAGLAVTANGEATYRAPSRV